MRLEYGDKAYCYMCGLKEGRQCSCVYMSQLIQTGENIAGFKESLAESNVLQCENKNKQQDMFIFDNLTIQE